MSSPVEEPVNAAEADPTVSPDSLVGAADAHGVSSGTGFEAVDDLPGSDDDGEDEVEVGLGPED